MSEIDRLSNSGLYPALPISDQHRNRGEGGRPPADPRAGKPDPKDAAVSTDPRPPKSIIDEYA